MVHILETTPPKKTVYVQKDRISQPLSVISHSKRAFDLFFTFVCFVFLSPIFFLTVVAIKITSREPIIFKQKRAGLGAKPFTMYKVRTIGHDARVSGLGEFLRKTYIDELPQLWNVIRGDMSLVGPRPHILEQIKLYHPWQYRRLSVKPGITGLRQLSSLRKDIDFFEHIELDLEYISKWSLWLDFKILLRTFIDLSLRFWRA